MEGIQYKSLIIKLVDKQRFITENPCVTGSIPVGTTKKRTRKDESFFVFGHYSRPRHSATYKI